MSETIKAFMKFYSVSTVDGLVAAMAQHILDLSAERQFWIEKHPREYRRTVKE